MASHKVLFTFHISHISEIIPGQNPGKLSYTGSLILQNPHAPDHGTVIVVADLDTSGGAAGMDHLAAADIDGHMVDGS